MAKTWLDPGVVTLVASWFRAGRRGAGWAWRNSPGNEDSNAIPSTLRDGI